MLAFSSVWIGMVSLVAALVMVIHRPAFHDLPVTLVLWFGSPGAMCLAGLVLWAYRKEESEDPGIAGQRLQAKVAIGLAVSAAALVYALIIAAEQI